MKSRIIAAVVAVSLISGCAVSPTVRGDYSLIDPKGVDMARYQVDYSECAALANQAQPADSAAAGAVAGAVVMTVFGAVIGGIIGGREGARYGAKLGAATGAARGAVAAGGAAVSDQQVTLRNCLVGRGYNVIR